MPETQEKPDFVWAAEANKANAEARKADAEAVAALAQERRTAAEASYAEANAVKVNIEAEREREKRQKELATHERNHVYYFKGAVNDDSVQKCMDQLTFWMRTEPGCPIEIIFFSPGGSVIAGMALWDYIQVLRAANHRVTTVCYGYAASMAGILLQAGDERIMGRESYILIHEISTMAMGKIGEIEDEMEFVKKISERVIKIFSSRSKLTPAQIRNRWRRKDWWLDSDEAVKLGLVDAVR